MFKNTNKITVSLALVALLTAATAFASESSDPLNKGRLGFADDSAENIKLRSGTGDAVAGKEKSELCQGCHGEDGNSVEGRIPKLSGQYGKYIAKQLRKAWRVLRRRDNQYLTNAR